MSNKLLIGTRKGLMEFDKTGSKWNLSKTHFKGIPVSYVFSDDVNQMWWACLDHGHWGVKLHRSFDQGNSWEEIKAPEYPEGAEIKDDVPASLKYIWAMAVDSKGKVWMGTDPGGLFVTDNKGDELNINQPFWDHPTRKNWFGGGRDNPGIHSVVIDPRDDDHIYVAISCAGVFETKDGGLNWAPKNKGLRADFLPDPDAEIGQDPHLLVMSPSNPDVLWQQNHCGIYVSFDGAENWKEVTDKEGIANFGFAIQVDEENENEAWVIPGVSDEIRIAVDEKLCVCKTDNGGVSWMDQRKGLPQEACFDIVYRHAFHLSGSTLAFGTTTGNLFVSENKGDNWECISNYLPLIYSVHFVK